MKTRIITAIIGIIIFIPIVLIGSWPFTLITYLLATVALYELTRMYNQQKPFYYLSLASIFLWLFLYPNQYITIFSNSYTKFDLTVMFIIFLLILTVITKNNVSFETTSYILFATLYVGIGFSYLITLRGEGINYLLYVLFTIWATDTGAYFVGRAVGKRKLWPAISPNKTIGGAIGGILLAILVGTIFQYVYPFHFSLFTVIIISAMISIMGQIGDLVASALKRHFAVKDAGNLFPGHGGVLDRFDSLVFVLIVLSIIRII